MSPLTVLPYRTKNEMQRVHPEVRNWKCILQTPRGMTGEVQLTNLRKAIQRKNLAPQIVYQIGDFFWIPETCRCLERILDNGPCPVHGQEPAGRA